MTKVHTLTQMDNEDVDLLRKNNRQLLRKGKFVRNSDKPTMAFNNIITIPRPRLHFPHGVGMSDTVVMSIDPRVLTTHCDPCLGPTDYLDLAKIPGISSSFMWHMNSVKNSLLFNEKVQPFPKFEEINPINN